MLISTLQTTVDPCKPHIIDPEGLAAEFVAEWLSPRPAVAARTSGSTGAPKEVLLPKSDMLRSARATCRRFAIGAEAVLHLPLSTSYIAGKMMVVRAMVSGATLVVERPSNRPLSGPLPAGVERIDLTAVVPSQVDGLLASPHARRVSNVIVGGGALPEAVERRLAAAPMHAWATYGMTETSSHVALRDVSAGAPTYRALPGITFAADSRGCLVVAAEGYSFGRIATNDVVELLSPSEFRWLGRYDNVVNSGGIKLFPEEMERRLQGLMPCPYYIAGRPSERWGQEAVLVVQGATAAELRQVEALIARTFDRRSAPKAIINVERFTYAANGKIKRIIPGN